MARFYIFVLFTLLFEIERAKCGSIAPAVASRFNGIAVNNTVPANPTIAVNNTVPAKPSNSGECVDQWTLCPILAGSGFCTSNCLLGSWTEAGCKKSCGECNLQVAVPTTTNAPATTSGNVAGTLELNSNVDIAFMMDSTASMSANIAGTKAAISTIVKDVKDAFTKNVIRMGFVAYRDYSEGPLRIETFDFTENITTFTNNLGNIRAMAGGDYPEDVLGAINATMGLNWKAANKLFFQIGDAPPRGFCGRVGQTYDGLAYKRCTAVNRFDLAGPQAPDLFESIDENCMIYNVLQTDAFQDDMVAKFTTIAQPHNGAKRFKVYDMKSGGLNFGEVSAAVIESIRAQLDITNRYLNTPNAPRDRCIKVA